MAKRSINELIDAAAIDVSDVGRVLDALREARAVLMSVDACQGQYRHSIKWLLKKWGEHD